METPSHNNNPLKHFSLLSFIAGLVIALLLFFIIYKSTQHSSVEKPVLQKKDTLAVRPTIPTFISDSLFSGEHFAREHHHRHIDQDAEALVVSPKETDALEKGNLSEQQKKLLELLPNAAVIYIFDLKITDYQNLYFNMGEPLILSGKYLAGQVLHDAMKDFSEKNFRGCLENMKLLINANPGDVNALFYSGMSAYYEKDYILANTYFQKVILSKNNIFRQEANWFSAMALYDEGKKEEAKKLFEKIRDTRGFYADRAEEKLRSKN